MGWGNVDVGLKLHTDVHATLWLCWGRVGWGGVGHVDVGLKLHTDVHATLDMGLWWGALAHTCHATLWFEVASWTVLTLRCDIGLW